MKKQLLIFIAVMFLFASNSYGANFNISIEDAEGFDIAALTVWLDVDQTFQIVGGSLLKGVGQGIPPTWFDDTSLGTVADESSKRVFKLGSSDFMAALGMPLTPLQSGNLFSFQYEGLINGPFLIELTDLNNINHFANGDFFVKTFDQNNLILSSVPVPSSLLLLSGGLFALVGITRRKK